MTGKSKCKILKDIRRQIAENNDIAYITSECKFQGECSGTCPKCEAELRYLEEELRKRQAAGKAVAVAGITATLLVGSTGCTDLFIAPTGGAPMIEPTRQEELQGDIAVPGAILPPTELMGDPTQAPTQTDPADMGELMPPTDETEP